MPTAFVPELSEKRGYHSPDICDSEAGHTCPSRVSLVSLLMLRSSINEKMLLGSLLPPNFQSAIVPECLGVRVGCGSGVFSTPLHPYRDMGAGEWDISLTISTLEIGKPGSERKRTYSGPHSQQESL